MVIFVLVERKNDYKLNPLEPMLDKGFETLIELIPLKLIDCFKENNCRETESSLQESIWKGKKCFISQKVKK